MSLGRNIHAGLAVTTLGMLTLIAGIITPASASGTRQLQVICMKDWGTQPEGRYRIRPPSCDLHERGKFPVASVNVYSTRRLHWLHWGPKDAVAKGKVGISTYGFARLRLRLVRPRQFCGHTVFTKVRLEVWIRSRGRVHRSRFTTWPDRCLP